MEIGNASETTAPQAAGISIIEENENFLKKLQELNNAVLALNNATSDLSTRLDAMEAQLNVKQLTAETATITKALSAAQAKLTNVTATEVNTQNFTAQGRADFIDLTALSIRFTSQLQGLAAVIEQLSASAFTVTGESKLNGATIADLSATLAEVQTLSARTIKDVDGLVAETVHADKGAFTTLAADTAEIKTVESELVEGSTVNAEKLNATDLEAKRATLGTLQFNGFDFQKENFIELLVDEDAYLFFKPVRSGRAYVFVENDNQELLATLQVSCTNADGKKPIWKVDFDTQNRSVETIAVDEDGNLFIALADTVRGYAYYINMGADRLEAETYDKQNKPYDPHAAQDEYEVGKDSGSYLFLGGSVLYVSGTFKVNGALLMDGLAVDRAIYLGLTDYIEGTETGDLLIKEGSLVFTEGNAVAEITGARKISSQSIECEKIIYGGKDLRQMIAEELEALQEQIQINAQNIGRNAADIADLQKSHAGLEESVSTFEANTNETLSELKEKDNQLGDLITANTDRLTEAEAKIDELQNGKQDKLTFDEEPTAGSENPVTSNGIAEAVKNASQPDALKYKGEYDPATDTPPLDSFTEKNSVIKIKNNYTNTKIEWALKSVQAELSGVEILTQFQPVYLYQDEADFEAVFFASWYQNKSSIVMFALKQNLNAIFVFDKEIFEKNAKTAFDVVANENTITFYSKYFYGDISYDKLTNPDDTPSVDNTIVIMIPVGSYDFNAFVFSGHVGSNQPPLFIDDSLKMRDPDRTYYQIDESISPMSSDFDLLAVSKGERSYVAEVFYNDNQVAFFDCTKNEEESRYLGSIDYATVKGDKCFPVFSELYEFFPYAIIAGRKIVPADSFYPHTALADNSFLYFDNNSKVFKNVFDDGILQKYKIDGIENVTAISSGYDPNMNLYIVQYSTDKDVWQMVMKPRPHVLNGENKYEIVSNERIQSHDSSCYLFNCTRLKTLQGDQLYYAPQIGILTGDTFQFETDPTQSAGATYRKGDFLQLVDAEAHEWQTLSITDISTLEEQVATLDTAVNDDLKPLVDAIHSDVEQNTQDIEELKAGGGGGGGVDLGGQIIVVKSQDDLDAIDFTAIDRPTTILLSISDWTSLEQGDTLIFPTISNAYVSICGAAKRTDGKETAKCKFASGNNTIHKLSNIYIKSNNTNFIADLVTDVYYYLDYNIAQKDKLFANATIENLTIEGYLLLNGAMEFFSKCDNSRNILIDISIVLTSSERLYFFDTCYNSNNISVNISSISSTGATQSLTVTNFINCHNFSNVNEVWKIDRPIFFSFMTDCSEISNVTAIIGRSSTTEGITLYGAKTILKKCKNVENFKITTSFYHSMDALIQNSERLTNIVVTCAETDTEIEHNDAQDIKPDMDAIFLSCLAVTYCQVDYIQGQPAPFASSYASPLPSQANQMDSTLAGGWNLTNYRGE